MGTPNGVEAVPAHADLPGNREALVGGARLLLGEVLGVANGRGELWVWLLLLMGVAVDWERRLHHCRGGADCFHGPASSSSIPSPSRSHPEPGVAKEGLKAGALLADDLEALPNQVLAFGAESGAEADVRATDLLVGLEGDVAAHHVKEEDAEAPDGGLFAIIPRQSNPFRRSVNSRTCNAEK